MEEWEKFASKAVSLRTEAMKLRALVIRWRKMELYTWPKALRGVEEKYHLSGINAFFHLWTVLHVTPTWTGDSDEGERAYFLTLYDTLTAFLRSQCKVGEFETRLDVVRAFAHQMAVAVQVTAFSDPVLHRFHQSLHSLLSSLYEFHHQWLPLVQSFIAGASAPLEKQLVDAVQLARWDLGNYEQLRESSEKNHKRLVSVSRRYDEILAMNVATVIDREEDRRAREKTVDLGKVGRDVDRSKKIHQQYHAAQQKKEEQLQALGVSVHGRGEEETSLSIALFTLPPPVSMYVVDPASVSSDMSSVMVGSDKPRSVLSIFHKMQRLLSTSMLNSDYSAIRRQSGAAVEGFTVEVIDRIRSLQSSDANRHRKMKALVDVRKSLEGLGLRYTEEDINKAKAALSHSAFSPPSYIMTEPDKGANLTQRIAADLVSVPLLFQCEPLSSVFSLSASARYTVTDQYAVLRVLSDECDELGWKVAAVQAKVKVKVHSHHADLSAMEVKKGRGMLEYLIVRIARIRTEIARLGRDMQSLGHWIDNIRAVTQHSVTQTQESADVVLKPSQSFWQHKLSLDGLLTAVQSYVTLYQRLVRIWNLPHSDSSWWWVRLHSPC